MSHFQRDQLWIVGEQIDASTYNFYYTESFMEYFLESLDLQEVSYSISEGTIIPSSHAIRRLVRKIVETLATMLPNRDFEVGLVERVTQDPARPIVQSQRLEPSSDFQFDDDEPLIEIESFYRHYTVRSAHHFYFNPHIEGLVFSVIDGDRRLGIHYT